jgi:hypothetical protein
MRNKNVLLALGFVVLIGCLAQLFTSFGRGSESSADPITLVRDVDNPTKQPFQQEVKVNVTAGLTAGNNFITIPTGKLLVIEHVSVQGKAPVGQNVFYSIYNHVAPDLTERKHIFPATNEVFNGGNWFLVSESLRLYADAPSITLYVDRDATTGTATALFVVSGYFVDKQF